MVYGSEVEVQNYELQIDFGKPGVQFLPIARGPTARPNPAQGEALGHQPIFSASPEGANQSHRSAPRIQASLHMFHDT